MKFFSPIFVFALALPGLFGNAGKVVAADSRPNVLFVISDDQSWLHASAYGTSGINTPGFDRVAKAGALFNNAIAASPGCSPCRAAILTGRHTWQIEQAGTHASSFPKKYPVFTDLLASDGYHVGYTGKGWGPGNYKISGWEQNPAGPNYSKRRTKENPAKTSNLDYAANFEDFLSEKQDDQPFLFWFGAQEPHRPYDEGLGKRMGRDPASVEVPSFLPDREEIRSDILDYYIEIEYYDSHLVRMLDLLEKRGELENTLVIVTSDNGMPFPRAKANCYEYGIHMPLAICWPGKMPGGRTVDDLIGFVDITATILDVAGVAYPENQLGLSGRSFQDVLLTEKSGVVDSSRKAVYSARERHSSSRYNNLTYPQRAIRTSKYLLIHNFRPERWPAGAPQVLDKEGRPGPPHGGYHDIDAGPSLSFLVDNRDDAEISRYFHLSVDKRPEFELFDIESDPGCIKNLVEDPNARQTLQRLASQLNDYLKKTGDPRVLDGGDIYESYIRYSHIRSFPPPQE